MKLRNLLFIVFCISFADQVNAQSNLLNAKTPDQIGKKTEAELLADNDKPLPYGYVHDRDVMFGRKVWEYIDLDERVNFPLYFPVDANLGPDRKPLYDVLVKGMEEGTITEVFSDSYFQEKKSLKDIKASLTLIDTTDAGRDQLNAGLALSDEFIDEYKIEAFHVAAYKTVGFWYFDKRQGELKYRLLGICPVVPDVYSLKNGDENLSYVDLFWVYFPSSRDLLHSYNAFNARNSAMPFSFDHLLNSRRFNAVIYKEENVLADREIKDYVKENALMQLLESEAVKDKIRDFEHDMWSY